MQQVNYPPLQRSLTTSLYFVRRSSECEWLSTLHTTRGRTLMLKNHLYAKKEATCYADGPNQTYRLSSRVLLPTRLCWAPESFQDPFGYLITDGRLCPLSGYLDKITGTETDNFSVGYSVGYSTQTAILRHVHIPKVNKTWFSGARLSTHQHIITQQTISRIIRPTKRTTHVT